MRIKAGECAAFILFVLSASAMDSEHPAALALMCAASLLFLMWRSKKMVVCRQCGGNFDNGELTGGICEECLEEERQRENRATTVAKIMNSQSYQMELRLEGMKSGKKAGE